MKKKIIGATVGSQLPKPSMAQNDPRKGDFIKNRTHWEDDEGVHPLDEKFIPDSIARKTDIPTVFSGSWNDLSDKPFGEADSVATIEWDGSTRGRRTWVSGGGGLNGIQYTYYKISDLCPGEDDVVGSVIEFSNGTTRTITQKDFYGFTDHVAYVNYLCLVRSPIVTEGNVIDQDAVGVYARNEDGVYPARYTFGVVEVHPLDEKYIPESIARVRDVEELISNVGGGGLNITDDGEGNVTITASAGVTITDDGNGNVVIG